jgi:hypothetical protein
VSEFPVGPVSKSENPDFLVQSADHTIGIELTSLFRKSAQGHSLAREQESLRERVAAETKSRYEAMKRPPIRQFGLGLFVTDRLRTARIDPHSSSASLPPAEFRAAGRFHNKEAAGTGVSNSMPLLCECVSRSISANRIHRKR